MPSSASVLPYLSLRSQSINDARELVGWQTQINKGCMCDTYGSFSITPEYLRSFKSNCLAYALFGDYLLGDSCQQPALKIEGTKVNNRDPRALMAENFYLPTDYKSVVEVHPRIENFLIDLNMYIGLDRIAQGLYFRAHGPVVWTKWALNYNETKLNSGSQSYDPGYFSQSTVSRDAMLGSFEEYVNDRNSLEARAATATSANFAGEQYNPLENARWSRCPAYKTGFADLRMALGWNFVANECAHCGFNIYAAAPTGTRPTGKLLFEPVIGNGKHWELGGGFTSHCTLSQNECANKSIEMYLDANITHLFRARQYRTFDVEGNPLSRYMLVETMQAPANGLYAISSENPIEATAPDYQFSRELSPLANFSTIPVNVSAAVQADVVLKFSFTNCNFQWDLGYNFWTRTREHVCPLTDCKNASYFPTSSLALKGDAFVYGFNKLADGTLSSSGIPLSATQSNATITGGTNDYPGGATVTVNGTDVNVPWNGNPGIDNPAWATSTNVNPQNYPLYTEEAAGVVSQVLTSLQGVLLDQTDLAINDVQARGLSNKLFTHFGYTWNNECRDWTPFLGLGGEIEFGLNRLGSTTALNTPVLGETPAIGDFCGCRQNISSCNNNTVSGECIRNSCCKNDTQSCCRSYCSLSQWGVWIKAGVSFN